jgi:uncharacterized membrane protein
MEKRIFGIILTLLGIAGLVAAAITFVQTNADNRNIKAILVYSILGAVFFFAGIGLIRNTQDVKNRNEEIS